MARAFRIPRIISMRFIYIYIYTYTHIFGSTGAGKKRTRLRCGAASHVSAKDMTMSLSLDNQAKTPASRHVNETSAKRKAESKCDYRLRRGMGPDGGGVPSDKGAWQGLQTDSRNKGTKHELWPDMTTVLNNFSP